MTQSKTFDLGGITWEVRMLDPDEQIEVECILLRVIGPGAGVGASTLVQGAAPALVEMLRNTVTDTGHADRVMDSMLSSLTILCPTAKVAREGDDVLVLQFESAEAATAVRPAVESEVEILMTFDADAGPDVMRLTLSEYVAKSAKQPFEIARLLRLDTTDPQIKGAWDRLLDALSATAGEIVSESLTMLASRVDHRDLKRLFELVLLGPNKTTIRKGDQVAKVASYSMLGQLLQRDPRAKWAVLWHGLKATYAREPSPDSEDDGDA